MKLSAVAFPVGVVGALRAKAGLDFLLHPVLSHTGCFTPWLFGTAAALGKSGSRQKLLKNCCPTEVVTVTVLSISVERGWVQTAM